MKYEKEINEIITTIIPKEKWMSDSDYAEVVELTLKHIGTDLQGISNDIEKGIKNGHSVESQLEIIKNFNHIDS
jgi:hypothetical protein